VLTSYTSYRGIIIELVNFIPATDNVDLLMRVSTDGGSSYDAGAGNYKYALPWWDSAGSSSSGSSSATAIGVAPGVGNGASEGTSGLITVLGQTNTAIKPRIGSDFFTYFNSDVPVRSVGTGVRLAAQDTDAIRILFASGNIASGSYAVYGLV
jgi:hypothetical protein